MSVRWDMTGMSRQHRLCLLAILATLATCAAMMWSAPAGEADPFSVTIDAHALSIGDFDLIKPDGTITPVYSTASAQMLTLPAGSYLLQPGHGLVMSCSLTVAANGTWDFPQTGACSYLSGAGSTTLTIHGFPITIDATALSDPIIFAGAYGLNAAADQFTGPRSFTLVPLTTGNAYEFQPGSGIVSPCGFNVDANGDVLYDATAMNGCIEGLGTTTATFEGEQITIDARDLTTDLFDLPDNFRLSQRQDSTVLEHYRLLPLDGYRFMTASAEPTDLTWNVGFDGNVSYDPRFGNWVGGAGTSTLHIIGFPETIDATRLGTGAFTLENGWFPHNYDQTTVLPVQLVPLPNTPTPADYVFSSPAGTDFNNVPWYIDETTGKIVVDPSLPCVSGNGTNELTLGCTVTTPIAPPTTPVTNPPAASGLTTPPATITCPAVKATPNVLWPAKGGMKLVRIAIEPTTDPLTDWVYVIGGVTQDEPIGRSPAASRGPDAARTGDPHAIMLRAVRAAHGDGRVYEINVQMWDTAHTFKCQATATVTVPLTRIGRAHESGRQYNSFASVR